MAAAVFSPSSISEPFPPTAESAASSSMEPGTSSGTNQYPHPLIYRIVSGDSPGHAIFIIAHDAVSLKDSIFRQRSVCELIRNTAHASKNYSHGVSFTSVAAARVATLAITGKSKIFVTQIPFAEDSLKKFTADELAFGLRTVFGTEAVIDARTGSPRGPEMSTV